MENGLLENKKNEGKTDGKNAKEKRTASLRCNEMQLHPPPSAWHGAPALADNFPLANMCQSPCTTQSQCLMHCPISWPNTSTSSWS